MKNILYITFVFFVFFVNISDAQLKSGPLRGVGSASTFVGENGEQIVNTTDDQFDFKDDDGTVYLSITSGGATLGGTAERITGKTYTDNWIDFDSLGSGGLEVNSKIKTFGIYGDPYADYESEKLAGEILEILTDPRGLWVWNGDMATESDLSGNGHTLTSEGGMTAGDQIHKGSVWAVDLDGSNDAWSATDHADFSFGDGASDSPFSVCVWAEKVGNNDHLISKWSNTPDEREWNLFIENSTNKLQVRIYDETNDIQITRTEDVATADGWHQMCFTYDGAGGASAADTIKIYVDGVLKASTASNNASYVSMSDQAAKLYIGAIRNINLTVGEYTGDLSAYFVEGAELSLSDIWKLHIKGKPFLEI